LTVEPGIYLGDWGGVRLENMVLLEREGAEVLNRYQEFYRW
jgi:Xaa-Pro aminopeptidase